LTPQEVAQIVLGDDQMLDAQRRDVEHFELSDL